MTIEEPSPPPDQASRTPAGKRPKRPNGGLLVIGSVNHDLIFRHTRLPRAGETISGAELFTSCGGKGANQAVAAVRCAGGLGVGAVSETTPEGRLSAPAGPGDTPPRETAGTTRPNRRAPAVLFAGAVGDDVQGRAQRDMFDADGLNTDHLQVLGDVHTGLSAVWVDAASGDNRIMNSPGANARLTASALRAVPVEAVGLLLIQNETPADGVRSAVRRAADAGVPVIWNPAPFDGSNDPGLDPEHVAWVTPNEVECAALLGRPDERIDAGTAACAATELLGRGYGGVALTLGPAGVMLAEPGGAPLLIPAPAVQAVDTTGAGDAFNGAFASALLASAGRPGAAEAARFAVRYASNSVTRHGTQTSFARC